MATNTTSNPTHRDGRTGARSNEADPKLNERSRIIQQPSTVRRMPLGLTPDVRKQMANGLNQVLVDTLMLYALYKKHHWQVAGHTFYQLHLLFDKHAAEQLELVDTLAERVQTLGGVAMGTPQDVTEKTGIERAPQGVEDVPAMIDRLLRAHEVVLTEVRKLAKEADAKDDQGTNDLLVSEVLRVNELQVWFIAEHVVDTPAV